MVYPGFGSDGNGPDEGTPFMVLALVLGGTGGDAEGGTAEGAAEGMIWFGAVGIWAAVAVVCPPEMVGGSWWVTRM